MRRRTALGLVLAAPVLAFATLSFWIPLLIYRPAPLPNPNPRGWGLPAARLEAFGARDGERLTGWWQPSRGDGAVLLILHGRSANISTRAPVAARLAAAGFGVLLFAYRGYGASGGSPSERGISEDGLAAYEWLRRRGVAPSRIILLGQSLGNAPAARLASLRPAAALVLVSPFTSLPGAVVDRYPWLKPLPWPRNRFDVAKSLARTTIPLVFVVGKKDSLVPVENARRLAEMQKRPVRWMLVEGAGHDRLLDKVTASGGFRLC